MHKSILFFGAALLLASTSVRAQKFDTSGTSSLSGPYLFRYVNFFNNSSGMVTESCSLSGTITFDGTGKYSLSNTQLFDSAGTGAGSCSSLGGGTYGVQSNGMAQMDNPLYAATLFGSFTKPVILATSTEDDYFDLFIAVQAPSAAQSNSSLSGTYTAGTLDFLNASSSLARQGFFTLNSDGKGNIATFTLTGSAENLTPVATTQSVAGTTYSLSGTSGGSLMFAGSMSDQTKILAGTRVLYVSADGNYILGGSATGSDMIFGFRSNTGSPSNSILNGTYFTGGMDANVSSSNFLDAFYGSILGDGSGNLFWHQRLDDVVDVLTFDSTFNTPVTLKSDGTYNDRTYNYLTGLNGNALLLIGSGHQYSLNIGIHAPSVAPSAGPWIQPTAIFNAANFAPITNAYAPGEFVSLFGNFGVAQQTASSFPIPTELGGVQVLVNGRPAPVQYVSGTQINALIPYEIAGTYFATFQVAVNQNKSNSVTVYVDKSSPGIYTQSGRGSGPGAILHADYKPVTSSNPAKPGETVLLYVNGLGTVTPTVADGTSAPSNPLSMIDGLTSLVVSLSDGVNTPSNGVIQFAGLAPGFAGLYQINFTLPMTGLANGDVALSLGTFEGFTSMTTIHVAGFTGVAAPISSKPAIRPHTGSSHRRLIKASRRGLPPR